MKFNATYSFPLFERFRLAVDNALALPVLFAIDEAAIYSVAFEAIQLSIGRSAKNNGGKNSQIAVDIAGELGEIAKEATFAHLLTGVALEPYFSVAHTLRDALLQTPNAPEICATDRRWIDAIHIALAFARQCTAIQGVLRLPHPRHVTVADAIRFFTDKSISLVVTGDRIGFPSGDSTCAVAASLSSPMKFLGDTLAMRLLDGLLETTYEPQIGRLRLRPTLDSMGMKLNRGIPYGLIYRFSLKTLGRGRMMAARTSTVESIVKSAMHVAALHDVEPFSVFETVFPSKQQQILEMLRNVMIFDELFTIPQCRPEAIYRLLDELFGRVATSEATSALQWSIADARVFWQLLLEQSVHPSSSTFIDRERFKALLNLRVGQLSCEGLLRSFVIDKPNDRYQLPSDAHQSETRECVMANASDGRYWIPGYILMGPPFYERLFASRMKYSHEMSGDFGRAFEEYLVERMTKLGITCRRGDLLGQKKSDTAGDADLIIETDKFVGLFELKKKGLQRRTNAGNDLQLAIDIANGLVHGVNQLARQEISLLRDGKLSFKNGSAIHLNNRRIIKVVISLADYGGLHDSALVRNTLRGLCGCEFTAVRPISEKQKKALEDVSRIFKVLEMRNLEFCHVKNKTCGKDIFDNIVFRNIFFIESLLATARTSESFLNALLVGFRVSTGSRDPFFDHAQFDPQHGR